MDTSGASKGILSTIGSGLGLPGFAKAGVGAGAVGAGAVSGGYGVGAAPAGGIFAGASAGVIAGVGAFMALWVYKLISLITNRDEYPPGFLAKWEAAVAAGTARYSATKSGLKDPTK